MFWICPGRFTWNCTDRITFSGKLYTCGLTTVTFYLHRTTKKFGFWGLTRYQAQGNCYKMLSWNLRKTNESIYKNTSLQLHYLATFRISFVAPWSFFFIDFKPLWPFLVQWIEVLRLRTSDIRGDLEVESLDGASS